MCSRSLLPTSTALEYLTSSSSSCVLTAVALLVLSPHSSHFPSLKYLRDVMSSCDHQLIIWQSAIPTSALSTLSLEVELAIIDQLRHTYVIDQGSTFTCQYSSSLRSPPPTVPPPRHSTVSTPIATLRTS